MPRMSSTDRRALILQAAVRVIAAKGVGAATTRAIVAEAGMSLASFHYAYTSHAEMMREVIAFVVGAETDAVFASLRLGTDIRSAVRSGLQAYLDYVVADPEHEQAMQELLQFALRTPSLRHLAREQYERYHSAVKSILVEGAAVSGVIWTIPVDDVARMVVTITDGVTLAWLVDRDTAAAERVLDFAAESFAALTASREVAR